MITCSIDIGFINGHVLTVNQNNDTAEAVGVKGNKIAFVGKTADLLKITGRETRIIDLDGRSLLPGFIDTHFHPILSGFFGKDADSSIIDTSINNCSSIEDILYLVRKAAEKKGPGAWISMMGYDQNTIKEKRHITLKELDQAAPNNPVQCMRTCGHVCVYNSKALEEIGVYKSLDAKKYPENEIVIENNRLTGIVKDHTHFLLWSKVVYSKEEQIKAAIRSNQLLLKNGITSIHDAGEFMASSYRIMQKLCKEREFKPRVNMLIHNVYGKRFALEENEHFLQLGFTTGLGDELFRVGPCKFMIDGGTGGPSCATRMPYSHDPSLPGILGWEKEEIASYIKRINEAWCQATAHAVGDLAVEYMVEGYEKAFFDMPRNEARHRIEHCTLVDLDLIRRMAKMNICPSLIPGFISWNGSNYKKYYGERMKYFCALRSMLDEGVKASIGSDSPSGPVEPMKVIDAAINRIDRNTMEQTDPYQSVKLEEIIRAYTLNGAYSSYEDDIKGSIEVGKLADLIVLTKNIFKTQDLLSIRTALTMIDGIIEFEE